MSVELIGIIAATIALGTTMLASTRSLRQEVRDQRSELLDRMATMESGIRSDMNAMRSELRDDDSGLREEMRASNASLRDEIRASHASLRAEMQSGFKELGDRVTSVGDRLSKVEGIIEGMFWSGRNQPPDKPREGAA